MFKLYLFLIVAVNLMNGQEYPHLDKACKTCLAYDLKHACPNNPDIVSNAGDIIKRRGYKYETHPVVTDDGFELTMFRIIPKNDPKNVSVLVQHGLQMDATLWVALQERSLPFRLSDLGYDVWLGNYRGTPNTRLLDTSGGRQFYNYSFHELGIYDIPTMTSHISNTTGRTGDIIYIGHSMGVSGVMVYASELKDHARQHLRSIIALAPAVLMDHNRFAEAFRPFVVVIAPLLRDALELFGYPALLDNRRPFKDFAIYFCTLNRMNCELCRSLVQFGVGPDIEELQPQDLPLLVSYCMYSNPLKIITHYLLIAKYKQYVHYNYGKDGNNDVYHLEDINVPVHIFYGHNDILVTPEDSTELYRQLKSSPNKTLSVMSPNGQKPHFNHIDFITAKSLDVLHNEILQVLQSNG